MVGRDSVEPNRANIGVAARQSLALPKRHNQSAGSRDTLCSGWRPLAKYRGADSHERGAFLDRNRKIAAHSHGKLRQFDLELRRELIA